MTSTIAGRGAPLTLTGHPLQGAGAWALAVMAGRSTPQEVSAADLEVLLHRILHDACTAGAATTKHGPAYDWWRVLFALYPNSKVTHNGRPRDAARLRDALLPQFAPDSTAAAFPCHFCGAPASVLWAKSMLPLFDTNKALNSLPQAGTRGGPRGWPVCRPCRIAVWALPYGAWVTPATTTVLSSSQPHIERHFAARNAERANQIMDRGFEALPRGGPHVLALSGPHEARMTGTAGMTLYRFRNDNQEPDLRVSQARQGVPRFLVTVHGNRRLRQAWRLLEIALEAPRRPGQDEDPAYGPEEAARLVFEKEEGNAWSLLPELHRLLWETERWTREERSQLTHLATVHTRLVHGLQPKSTGLATMVADWIEHGPRRHQTTLRSLRDQRQRQRLQDFKATAHSSYRLGDLLYHVMFDLKLAGRPITIERDALRPLLQQAPGGAGRVAWYARLLLAIEVLGVLAQRDVGLSEPERGPHERELRARLLETPILQPEDETAPRHW